MTSADDLYFSKTLPSVDLDDAVAFASSKPDQSMTAASTTAGTEAVGSVAMPLMLAVAMAQCSA